ncbi:FAD protein [Venustampulla echinocandica]|uniref:FAD protein n=1 Tax=Venustampulla echinocandica TaxID=2656787 RepID=A0A370U241_9HELO|nr:FAD protein [Venustampulla echinocandica]RDL41850.1 FAD protein [Venustampulla echinocandica]
MDIRARLPVSLPHPNHTTSYWQSPLDGSLADFLSAETVPGDIVDTVVIGSGITGAGVAWNLLQQEKKREGGVVMLEARQTCSSATGRNGGHTKAASYRTFPSHAQTLGLPLAVKIARFEYANIQALHTFAAEHNIECEARSCDTVDVIYDQKQWEECVNAVEMIRRGFVEPGDEKGVGRYTLWSAEEAKTAFLVGGIGMDGESVKGAVSYEAGSIHASKFVYGVLKLCLGDGSMRLFTNTPATKIEKAADNACWAVHTPRGIIRARRVVLATNAYTSFLCDKFHGSIVPLRGQVTAQRPGSNMPPSGLQNTYSFIYNGGYEYMTPRPGSIPDIIIGGGLAKSTDQGLGEYGTTDDSSLNSSISVYLGGAAKTYFGDETWGKDDEQGRVKQEWTGIMGYTPDGFPFVGEVPDIEGMWIAAAFQGHGMVLAWESARALVGLMGREDVSNWFPSPFIVTEERIGRRFEGRRS